MHRNNEYNTEVRPQKDCETHKGDMGMGLQRPRRRANGMFAAAAFSAALLAGGVSHAWADENNTQGQGKLSALDTRVTLELTEAQLPVAVKMLRQKTGIEIIIINQANAYNTVSLSLRDKPVGSVLRLMAEAANADFWQKDGVFFIGPKGSAPKPEVEPMPNLNLLPSEETDNRPHWRYEKIKLIFTDPGFIKKSLGLDGGPVQDAMEMMRRNALRTMVGTNEIPYRSINTPSTVQFAPNAQPTIVAPSVPTATGNDGYRGASVGNTGNLSDQSAKRDMDEEFGRGQGFGGGGQYGGGGRGGGGGGQFGGGGGQFGGGGQAGLGQGAGGGQNGQGAGAGLLPQGITGGDLYAFDGDNSIIVRYQDERALRELKDVIRLLDVKPRQLMIKAEFITVTQGDVSTFGINWSFAKASLSSG